MRPITVLLLTVVVAVGLTSPLVASQSYITTTTTLSETHTSTTYSSSPVTTYSYTTASTQSYSASFTLSGRVKNSAYQITCYSESSPFDAQSGDVVTGTVHPGGVMLGIMDSSTYNDFSHAQADTCGNLISRYSENEHIDSNIDSNNVLHFTWKAPSTDHYYFVILNAGYDNDVKVDFAASQTGGFMASSTEYQTQTIQLLQTLVVSSIYSTIYTSMPQPPQPTATQSTNNTTPLLALAVIAAVVIGTAFLYSRRKEQPKVTKAEKVDSKTKKAGKNFCIECGKELTQESKFCNNCGAKQP